MMAKVSPTESTWLGGLGAIAGTAALGVVGGPTGLVAGVMVLVAWLSLSDLAAYALGHVALGAILVESAGPLALEPLAFTPLTDPLLQGVAVAAALLPLLLGPTLATRRSVVLAGTTLVAGGLLAAASLAPVLAGEAVWLGSAVLVTVACLGGYALHRYGLLVSGVLASG